MTGPADTAASAAHLRQILAFRDQHGRQGFDFDDDDVTAVLDEREQLVSRAATLDAYRKRTAELLNEKRKANLERKALEARVAELEAERHADTRAVADVFNAAIEQRYVKPALAEVLGGLHRRFADRIAALGQRDDAADGSAR